MNSSLSKALNVRQADFVIIGGGISGLAAAFYLQNVKPKERQPKIVVVEGSKRLGGWIHSARTREGAVHELGPRSVRPAGVVGKNSLNLVSSLGLKDAILPVLRSHPAAKKRFIYANGKLNTLPNSLASLISRQDPFTKPLLSHVAKEPFRPKSEFEDESVYNFFHRRLGKEITDYMVTALCRGIYAGDARELSIRSCFPSLLQSEKNYGSIVMGALRTPTESDPTVLNDDLVQRAKQEKWSVWSLQGGLQTLTERLERRLQEDGVEICTGQTCSNVEFTNDEQTENKVAIVTAGDSQWKTPNVISSIPSQNLGSLLADDHTILADHLKSIKSVTVATVNLEYKGNLLKEQGFGYLVPSNQPVNVLGVVFDSCSVPQLNRSGEETTRLTCMMGGAWFHELFGDPDNVDCNELLAVAVDTVRDHLGITATPVYTAVNVQNNCIPNYQVGHHKVLDGIDDYITQHSLPLTLLGASYRGVSVNDCIYQAKKAAQRLMTS